MMKAFNIDREEDTIKLAERISPFIKRGDIIALYGDLGTGKTFFTRYLCKALGVKELVTSPSFVLINQYEATEFKINHIDLFRLHNENDVLGLGIDDILEDGVTVIEWPLLAELFFNERTIKVYFQYSLEGRSAIIESNKEFLADIS
ncbi:MAG: tRNA (adenosine(37)-N6)-threonylcarbamoyltransferase complex ATPase subunit type 1 TsaE [Candidatus Cloacimonetes bacterium]|nr:tRNA (adenosine(37)-N6)-threonylcarbamoyltransferase complex ATPase subunit type 1 TsaE [Candidatus Cloacimonadota bacterium]